MSVGKCVVVMFLSIPNANQVVDTLLITISEGCMIAYINTRFMIELF